MLAKTDKIMVGRGVTGRDICLGKWWKGKNDRGMSGEYYMSEKEMERQEWMIEERREGI